MSLLVDFASANGLPLTLTDSNGNTYSSSSGFVSKEDYLETVQRKLGARALYLRNTGPALFNNEVQAGDLIISEKHAALVVNALAPGKISGGQTTYSGYLHVRPGVRKWDAQVAEDNPDDLLWIYNPLSTSGYRVDYLNHTGSVHRQQAEMKYNRSMDELRNDGFEFRYWADSVFH